MIYREMVSQVLKQRKHEHSVGGAKIMASRAARRRVAESGARAAEHGRQNLSGETGDHLLVVAAGRHHR